MTGTDTEMAREKKTQETDTHKDRGLGKNIYTIKVKWGTHTHTHSVHFADLTCS